jgi:hypothetical protein
MTATLYARNSPSATGIKHVAKACDADDKKNTKNERQASSVLSKTEDGSPSPTSKYGYGDATPDQNVDYGYGDAEPSVSSSGLHNKATRRSSMKQGGASNRRRASIHNMGPEFEVKLPGSQERVRRRSSISFNAGVRVKPVVPVTEMAENPQSLWFQDDEYDRMKEKSWMIVDKELESKQQGKSSKYCLRGLERMMNPGDVKQKKKKCSSIVLDEQDLQRKQGVFDDEYTRSLYKFTTGNSQKEAESRAKQDEAEIENYMRTTKKQVRRMSSMY